MTVLVDTSIWTLSLRRRRSGLSSDERAIVHELTELIRDDEVMMVGPIRQELLSGIRTSAEYDRLRERLADFPDEVLATEDFEEGATGLPR